MRRHAIRIVAGKDAEVDQGVGAAGQHVFLVAGLHHRQRGGGAQHGVGGGALLQLAFHERTEQPQVGKEHTVQAAHLRRDGVEHFGCDTAKGRWHLPILQPRQRRAQHADGGIRRRHRGVSRHGARAECEREIALFGGADEGHRPVEALEHALGDQQSFVGDEVELHAARLQQGGDGLGAPLAAEFLVVTEGKVDRLARLVAFRDEQFDGFHDGKQIALVVPRTPSPNEAVADFAAEGIGLPVLLGAGGDGHDILVRHQHDRFRRRVAAGPGIEQAELVHALALQHGVGARKGLLQQRVQLAEFFRAGIRLAVLGDGAQAHCDGQSLRRGVRIERNRLDRWHLHLARTVAQGIEGHREQQDDDECSKRQYDFFQHVPPHGCPDLYHGADGPLAHG